MGNTEQEYPELTVQLFGCFQVKCKDAVLNTANMRSEMLTKLLGYLLSHKDKVLTVQELVEVLWPDLELHNPGNGALKNLMYRLRNLLKKTFGDYDYVLSTRGTYRWNPAIVVYPDTEEFVERSSRAFLKGTVDEQIEDGKQIIDLYKGSFMSEIPTEIWVLTASSYYNSLYISVSKRLAELLEKQERFEELENLCRMELRFEPLDEELHCYLLRALIAENKQAVAMKHYQKTEQLIYDTLGVCPSEEMQNLYEHILKQEHEYEKNIQQIQEELIEDSNPEGTFYCEYGVFRKIYELELRRSSRMRANVHLAILSLSFDLYKFRDEAECKMVLKKEMKLLQNVISQSLRNSDVFCRYSATQFLIMLPTCKYEDVEMIMKRLTDSFKRVNKKKKVVLQYSIDEAGVM